MEFEIALYPGDGIGPDVLEQAVRVMHQVGERHGITFKTKTLPWGYEYWKQHGTVVPEGFLDEIREVDSILLGAVGWPDEIPDHETLAPLVKIRQAFDQFACVRPANLFTGLESVLAGRTSAEIDFVVIRENSEGEYICLLYTSPSPRD